MKKALQEEKSLQVPLLKHFLKFDVSEILMKENPYPSVLSCVSAQHVRNREASRQLEKARQIMELREQRHKEILEFTKKFLEKPRKGFFGRLLYDILWRTAEKLR